MVEVRGRAVDLFETPLVTESWGSDDERAALLEAIMARQNEDGGVVLSNILGWQSDDAMIRWGGSAAAALLDHVRHRGDALTLDIAARSGERRFDWVTNMWANVSPPGASNQTHCHPGAVWSAVFYVDDGYGDEDATVQGGELVLLDPRMPMIRMAAPDLRYRRSNGTTDHQEVWLRPTSGQLVLFPSWLMHSVRPYSGSRLRVSIAINLSARPRASERPQ